MRLLKIFAGLVLLLVAVAGGVYLFFDPNQFRPLLESKLSDALGREVKLGGLTLELMAGSVAASDISIGEDKAFGAKPFLLAKSLQASVELRPLIFDRKLNITGITLDQPELSLILAPNGQWNFSSLGSGLGKASSPAEAPANSSASTLAIKRVTIRDGKFTLLRPAVKEQSFADVDVELHDLSTTAPVAFQLSAKRAGGGSIVAEGTAGPLAAGSSALPPLAAKFRMAALDLNAAGLVDRSTGVGGVVGFSGDIKTRENILELTGSLRAEKLKLVPEGALVAHPVELAFTVAHNVARGAGQLSRADVRIGKALSTLTGTYDVGGKTAAFNMKFNGVKMPLTELAGLLPAFNIVLPEASKLEAGTLTFRSTISGTAGYFSAMGPITLEGVRLANFDLGTRLAVIQVLAGLPKTPATEIPLAAATVKHTPEGTLVSDLTMTVRDIGALAGSGTVDAKNQLDFHMKATIKTSGALMVALGQKGDTAVPFFLQGTTSAPVFKPDVKALAAEKIRQLTYDPVKTVNKAKELIDGNLGQDIFGLFRKKKPEPQQ